MKGLNDLLECIDDMIYDEKSEKIRVCRRGDKGKRAKEIYNNALSLVTSEKQNKLVGGEWVHYYGEFPDCAVWSLNVAIDCVRNMSDEERNQIRKYKFIDGDYGGRYNPICIKWNYHFKEDDFYNVKLMIFSILDEGYDYRDSRCVYYFQNDIYESLCNKYYDKAAECFIDVETQLIKNSNLTIEEALKMLREKLVVKIGSDEFINIVRDFFIEENENDWDKKDEDLNWEYTLRERAILFPIEYNQLKSLRAIRLLKEIEMKRINSQEECKQCIDNHLGLKEEYAKFMAKCLWAVKDIVRQH